MDWAQGFIWQGNGLTARGITADGTRCEAALTDLCRAGLPTPKVDYRRRDVVDFARWKRTDAAPYLRALGIGAPDQDVDQHEVFVAPISRYFTCVVPALAWHRAFFRPKRHVLSLFYGPQPLDRYSFLEPTDDGPRVHLTEAWARTAAFKRFGEFELPVAWMRLYPSASQMAHSVHRHAFDGRLGIDLPLGSARLSLGGIRHHRTLWVTELEVLEVIPGEEPIEASALLSDTLYFRAGARVTTNLRGRETWKPFEVPAHPDRTINLTDHEWCEVAPLFERAKGSPRRYDLRYCLDCVFEKVHSGRPWPSFEFNDGVNKGALQQIQRRMQMDGTLEKVLAVLRTSRA